MTIHRYPTDNSLVVEKAKEYIKDRTFENITIYPDGDIMEDDKDTTVHLHASTRMNGSEQSCDMGYTITEWRNLTEEEKTELIMEHMSNIIDMWVEGENGEIVY